MNLKLPEELNQILSFAREEAMRLGSYTITGDHIFLAIIRHQENQAYGILTMLDLLLWQMKNLIESKEMGRTMIPPDQADKLSLSEHAEKCLKAMYLEATKLGQTTPNSLHLLLAMLALDNGIGVYWLRTKGVTDQSLRAYLKGEYPLACEGTIDLTQDPDINFYNITTSGTTNNVTVTLDTPVALDPTVPVSVYMMVLPGIQETIMRISLTTEGIWKEMDKETPDVIDGFTRGLVEPGFARGKKYVVSLDTEDEGWGNEFTDSRDTNTYSYRLIGTQVWMTENLAYLPSVHAPDLGSDSSPRYYVYNYKRDNVTTAKTYNEYIFYGVLYNWPAAMGGSTSSSANPSGVQGACPSGWHLPSDAEWTTLTTYLGGESVAGGKMKETGNIGAETGLWNGSNFGATNVSGFSGRPGGFRSYDVGFAEIGNYGYWWSSTAETDSAAWRRYLSYLYRDVDRYYTANRIGLSVRCIRD